VLLYVDRKIFEIDDAVKLLATNKTWCVDGLKSKVNKVTISRKSYYHAVLKQCLGPFRCYARLFVIDKVSERKFGRESFKSTVVVQVATSLT
jgi:hypothetical protein